jgi:ribulose-phosphate 3-epimerase
VSLEISCSILAADFLHLADDIQSAVSAGVDTLHFDVMDGRFVPNLTFGPMFLKLVKSITPIPCAVHLMVEDPDQYLDECISAGADTIFVHMETGRHLHRSLHYIQEKGARPGVALNPSSPPSFLPYVKDVVEEILVMTVNPGFAAQRMIGSVLPKIGEIRELGQRLGKSFRISVDGGVNRETVDSVARAGADNVITASAFFGARDRKAFVEELRRSAAAISSQS